MIHILLDGMCVYLLMVNMSMSNSTWTNDYRFLISSLDSYYL